MIDHAMFLTKAIFDRLLNPALAKFRRRPVWDSSNRTFCWRYFCPRCKTRLTEGPSGGGVNLVCESCKINYGCLPGGWGE